MELINKNYGTKFQDHLLKQYEIFVASAEENSTKRMQSNRFYLLLNTVLFSLSSYLSFISNKIVVTALSGIGIILCLSWMSNISSYKKLNSAKFKIINELEDYLPSKPFNKEDKYLNSHYTISNLEKLIPIIFIFSYAIIIIFVLLGWIFQI
ncbi:MAG: hypothetical protein ABIH65_03820 [Nanoarchaeota archaeon]